MVLSAYGDESADETRQRVFAAAVLVGSEPIWRETEKTWLWVTGGKEFHAAEWESEYAFHPDPKKHKNNLQLYADLTQVIARSGLVGFGASLDLAGHREFFPDVLDDFAYYQCLMNVLRGATRTCVTLKADRVVLDKLEFIFDHRRESEHNAGRLYELFSRSSEQHTRQILGSSVSFESRSNPRIQMADLVARETMKHHDNTIGPKSRPTRRSMEALATTTPRRFHFEHYTREWCMSKREQFSQLEQNAGCSLDEFHRWLKENGLADNWSNRFRFVEWLDSRGGSV